MIIWYISKYVAPPNYTRVGTRGFFILKEFVKLGHDATLFTSDSNHLATPPALSSATKDEIIDGVKIRWIKTKKYSGVHSLSRVISWLSFDYNFFRNRKSDKPDVIIVSSLSLTTIIIGLILKLLYDCKFVFEVRDIWPLFLCETGGYSKYNPAIFCLRLLEKLGYRYSDLIVGTMPNLAQHVTESIKTKKKVLCIPHGVDHSMTQIDPKDSSFGYKKYLAGAEKFVVCYAGSMGEDNALETLIAAAKELETVSVIQFLLIGDGEMKPYYEQLASGSKNIVFTGMLPKIEVTQILKSVDILYFATHSNALSKYGQSLNKMIDYMAAGKIILGSYSGFPSMINEAECGEFISEGSVDELVHSIKRYLGMDANLRNEIGLRGRQWLFKERSFEKLAKEYLSVLTDL